MNTLSCKGCKIDKDEELLVICDKCNDAYHIYCMKNILAEVPSEEWFCHNCEEAKIDNEKNVFEVKDVDPQDIGARNNISSTQQIEERTDSDDIFIKFAWKKRKIDYTYDEL